jgi:PhoPQ-activated pathogenicity-related protein
VTSFQFRALSRTFFAGLLAAGAVSAADQTALDRYVAAPDPNYKYELVSTIPGEGCTTYVLDMTSQQWKTTAEVDRPLWKHWVTIVKPDKVATTTGFLYITGGSNGDKPPAKPDEMLTSLALSTNSIASEVRMVPNEPLTFVGETKKRSEDGIIAYTWDKYLRTGDDSWPLRLPMTKAAVRALDTVTSFCKSQGPGMCPEKYVVAGGSKRGWTTWTTAAVDRRVVAIAPFVIDLLNIVPSFEHHYRAYGFWAPAVGDYVAMGIMDRTDTPEYRALMKIEEPYSYRDRLTMPKYMINATGDQFFLPDSSQFYFDGLKGEKHLRYVPNTKHSLAGSDARESLQAFYESIVNETPRPDFSWQLEKDGVIRVKTGAVKPAGVKLWQATDPKARDFRLDTIGPAYHASPLEDQGGGVYSGKVEKPEQGWTAYFVELTYPAGGKYPLKFTTSVYVMPDVLPYPKPAPARVNATGARE